MHACSCFNRVKSFKFIQRYYPGIKLLGTNVSRSWERSEEGTESKIMIACDEVSAPCVELLLSGVSQSNQPVEHSFRSRSPVHIVTQEYDRGFTEGFLTSQLKN
jgi:hypothetical protein